MEKLDSAMNSLSDQTKKFDIAMYYTNGDQDKAKKMVSNSYSDMNAIKAKFSSSSVYGAFVLFFNTDYQKIEHAVFVISPDYQLQSLNSRDDWRQYEKEILNSRTSSASSRINNDFEEKFKKGFTVSLSKELARFISKNDMTQVTHMIQRFLQESSDLKRIEVSVDLQGISSLQMELDSLTSPKVTEKLKARKKAEEAKNDEQEATPANAEPSEGRDGVKLIVAGTLVLSPIKGKHISNLVTGDKIMVVMVEQTQQTIDIAKAFNAYDLEQNKINAVPARVTSCEYIDGIGYKIFAVIAKGILARIIEEESNIKIALDPTFQITVQPEQPKSKMGIPLILGLITAITLAILFIIFVVL